MSRRSNVSVVETNPFYYDISEVTSYVESNRSHTISDVEFVDILSDRDINESIIKERNEGVRQIAEDIEHIHDITNMLSVMVDEQGDNIEVAVCNIENANVNVQEATESLSLAEEYSVSANIKKLILGGTVASAGVAAVGAGVMLINPIAGGVIGIVGLTGVATCITTFIVKSVST